MDVMIMILCHVGRETFGKAGKFQQPSCKGILCELSVFAAADFAWTNRFTFAFAEGGLSRQNRRPFFGLATEAHQGAPTAFYSVAVARESSYCPNFACAACSFCCSSLSICLYSAVS